MTGTAARGRGGSDGETYRPGAASNADAFQRIHESAWPDMFANLQAAYAELTEAQRQLARRSAEMAEANDLFEQVLASMSEALFLMDHAGTIVRVNRAAGELLERDDKELLGRPLGSCFQERVPDSPWEVLERSLTGRITGLDVRAVTSAGGRVPVSLSASVVRDKQGRITGLLAVARDVTEQKRAEEALARQARELARSNTELEQFAYVASHDLQEPIRMVGSFTDLLAKRYRGALDEEADEFIEFIVDGATRMQRLVNDLLAYSRVGRKGHREQVDCRTAVEKACANLRRPIEESGAEIRIGPLPTVVAEQSGLTRVFQNLIGNAIKFRKEGRPVQVEVGARREAREWVLFVRDNGIGIDSEETGRLFQLFQRLHTEAEYPGTGIGLAICKKVVEQHGGRIRVESGPGEGSTFFFTLPAEPVEPDGPSQPVKPVEPGGPFQATGPVEPDGAVDRTERQE